MKRIGLIDIKYRIGMGRKSIDQVEHIYLKKMYHTLEDCQFDFISKTIKRDYKDALDANFSTDCLVDIMKLDNLDSYDMILIKNFSTTVYGGVFPIFTIKALRLITSYKGEIRLLCTDPALKPWNVASRMIKKYDKTNNMNFLADSIKPSIEELKDLEYKWENDVMKRINAVFVGYNFMPDRWGMRPDADCTYIPLTKIMAQNIFTKQDDFIESPEYDICYFGKRRGGKRDKKINLYLNCNELKKLIIGGEWELENQTHLPYISPDLLGSTVRKSMSSLVLCDKSHEDTFYMLRFYQNIMYGVVGFIDIDYDKNKKSVKNKTLQDFLYINNRQELIDKIEYLKLNQDFRKKIIQLQYDELI